MMRLLAVLLAGVSLAAQPVRFLPSVHAEDVSGIALPTVFTVAGSAAGLLAEPGDGAKSVQTLGVGEKVTVLQFAAGPERSRDCKASPFNGCIFRSTVWVQARKRDGTTGYCPLVDLIFPLAGSGAAQTPQSLFGYADAVKSGRRITFSIRPEYLPKPQPSFFDKTGWQHLIAKVLSPAGDLLASPRELEFLARGSGGSFSYEGGKDRSGPLMFDPPISGLSIQDAGAQTISVSRLLPGHKAGDGLEYKLPTAPRNTLAMILLSASAARLLKPGQVKVTSQSHSYKRMTTTVHIRVTGIDIDGNGAPDAAVYSLKESMPGCNSRTEQCGTETCAVLVLLDQVWYVTGGFWMGQEGLEGY